jgi:hypothetical protein
MSKFCLTLICARELEEKLLDALLTSVEDEVFTSTPTFSHGSAPGRLSSTEQVMGRSRSVQVQIVTTAEQLTALTELLEQEFRGSGLRYWACALTAEGAVA